MQDLTNRRDDAFGGDIENRVRLLSEVIDIVAAAWPRDRIGVRLSPLGQFNGIGDSDPEVLFAAVYRTLDEAGLAYLHVVE